MCTDCTDVNLPIITGAKGNQPKDKIRFVYINVYICFLVTVLPRSRTRGDLPRELPCTRGPVASCLKDGLMVLMDHDKTNINCNLLWQ